MKLKNKFTNVLIGWLVAYLAGLFFLILYHFFFGGWSGFLDGTITPFTYGNDLLTGYALILLGSILFVLIFYVCLIISKYLFHISLLRKWEILTTAIYIVLIILYVDLFADISPTGPERSISTLDFAWRVFLILICPFLLIFCIH